MTRERPDVAAVGLTGGIGAGKSTALKFFGESGALTLSADEVVHQLYGREDVRRALAEQFGCEVLALGGEVDRRRLAEAVRGRKERLAWLEGLTHPLVAREIGSFIASAPRQSVVVCEVPLMFEAEMQDLFDLIVTVEAGADTRRQRSIHAFGLDQFTELEALQASSERRVAGADMAFFNDGSVERLRAFVVSAYDRALVIAAGGREAGRPEGVGAPRGGAVPGRGEAC